METQTTPAVHVAGSPIHGYGLFASRAIAAGEVLCEYRGERITKEESRRRATARAPGAPVYTVALDDRYDIDGEVPENPAKFANHGCTPNAALVATPAGGQAAGRDHDSPHASHPGHDAPLALHLVATHAIAPGEEILFDYGFGLADSLKHPCRCSTPGCAGRIIAAPLRTLLKRHLPRPRPAP